MKRTKRSQTKKRVTKKAEPVEVVSSDAVDSYQADEAKREHFMRLHTHDAFENRQPRHVSERSY